MKKYRRGFTLIEVSLFLAVTGVLFVGVTIGVQNSIFQQRFSDSVQNYVDFLKNIYSEVSNIQSDKPLDKIGRSEQAVYGRIALFGETMYPDGSPANDGGSRTVVFVYDVVGEIGDIGTGNIIDSMVDLNANSVVVRNGRVEPAGIVDEYSPRWGAQIENVGNFDDFKGAILIVRHPRSGSVYTAVKTGASLEINREIYDLNAYISASDNGLRDKMEQINNILVKRLVTKKDNGEIASHLFSLEEIDFCINPLSNEPYSFRRDVRLSKNARNASGINIVAEDLGPEVYKCGM